MTGTQLAVLTALLLLGAHGQQVSPLTGQGWCVRRRLGLLPVQASGRGLNSLPAPRRNTFAATAC